jgi:hypothetical protein
VKKVISAIALFLAFAFIAVGYAALSDVMIVDGNALFTAPRVGVFITALEVVPEGTSGVTDKGSSHLDPTNVNSVVSVSAGGAQITYKITVENNTDMTTWYQGTKVIGDLDGENNDLIVNEHIKIETKDKFSDNRVSFDIEDWVPPHTTREFYAVYKFGSSATGAISTLVNFSFGTKIESYGDEVLAILNGEKYKLLVEAFEKAYEKTGSTVLSNVGADAEFLESLFGTEIQIDGNPVNIVIERKNVDGDTGSGDSYSKIKQGDKASDLTGCEYTFYISDAEGKIHAVSYMHENGKWRQIGELYEGDTTKTCTYTDSEGKTHTVMDVGSWEVDESTYTLFKYGNANVTYNVGYRNSGDQYDRYRTISDLMGAKETNTINWNLYNSLNRGPVGNILRDTNNLLKNYENSDAPEIVMLREAFLNVMKYYKIENGVDYVMISSGWTRAEIIAVFEKFQQALEYYDQVHS